MLGIKRNIFVEKTETQKHSKIEGSVQGKRRVVFGLWILWTKFIRLLLKEIQTKGKKNFWERN